VNATAILVTPPDEPDELVLGIVGRALQGGLNGIVVRRPRGTARSVFEMVRRLRPATRKFGCTLLVSDRIDVALAAEADGVHLGARSLPTAAARRILKPGMLLGRSVHNLDEVGQRETEGCDYLFLGHLFASASHPREDPIGLDAYREAVLRSTIPVVAIGGITSENVRLVAQAGGGAAAAIGAFFQARDSAETARAFRAAFAS
jgi:thiamine-phosphate pyrophosphorylase